MVTVSCEQPEDIAKDRGKHGAQATMLADPDLKVTTLYNIRNEKNLMKPGDMGGPLPIPTTILVDKEGIVRWIDQAEDAHVRSEPDRVLAAVSQL